LKGGGGRERGRKEEERRGREGSDKMDQRRERGE